MSEKRSFIENIKLGSYYLFGNTFGRIAYPRVVFRSRWFARPGSMGWKWLYHCFWSQKVCGRNRQVPWPCDPRILAPAPKNIKFDMDDLNNFMTAGVYYQSAAEISIGKGTYIAPNVGLITRNHDISNPDRVGEAKPISLGEKCWIGMNSVILPGVVLGPHTVVGAGSVVTKSFPEGYVVLVGSPAKVLKTIDKNAAPIV